MQLDEKGIYIDIRTGADKHRTFISSAKLAKYVYNTEGPHVVFGGNSVRAKQEAAGIIKNVHTAIRSKGLARNENEWYDAAALAARL